MTTAIYPRPPRRPGPRMPRGEVVVEAPPELTRRRSAAAAQLITVVPMMGSVGSMAVLFTSGGNAGRMWISAGFFAVSAVAMLFGMAAGGGVRRADVDAQRRDYMRRLGQVRKQLRRAVDEQRLAATWQHPDPHVLWSLIGARRMWERRPDDDDFAEVRIGLGEQRAAVTVTVAQQKPVEDSEPLSVIALKRFRRGHDYVPALPRSVRLAAFQRVGVDGDRDKAVALVRAVLCQLAAFHAPDDLRIALVVADGRRADWDWLKWLPHVQQPEAADGSGTARLVFESLIDFEDAVPEDLSGRVGSGGTSVPQIVVVIDGGDAPTTAKLRRSEYAGVTLLDLSGVTRRGAGRDILLSVAADGALSHLDGKRVGDLGIADALSETEADALARQIAPWRPEPRAATRSSAPRSAELPDLLGIADIESFDPASTGRRSARARLRVPLGLAPDGAVVELDFKESAHQGMGPHGLLIGGTGSGKSELLRTIVMGLAATHSSDDLNFVLVDFKGGATFAPFAGLPHISAVVTNLSDELSLVDRMEAAVGGELVRRQELLRDAGNYASRFDYENARQRGVPLDPLPSLLIICDEFSELLTARPGFADLFVQIGRVGRSMGVHLLLASQRLDEGKLRGLESLLSYRICLRTDTASDSRAVLRSTVAFELPKDAAGSGYLQPDPATLLRFRGAMVSGEYQRRQAGVGAVAVAAAGRQVVRFVLSSPPVSAQPAPTPAPAPVPPPAAALPTGESDEGTLLEIFVDRLRGHGRPAHKVWLEPLGVPPTLDELLPRLKPDPERGLQPVGAAPGTLTVPVGIVDQPAEQRCDPLVLQLGGTGAGGNVVVVGGTRSGKSTLLRTLICALALTHTPAEVQFFCLDFSGGALRGLDGLPHVSGVAGRRDTDAVRRTIAEIGAILEAREEAFARHGVESMEVWRQRRASGAITDDSFGDVFLVIDGWATVREDFEAQEGVITGLAARGLNFGVHLVIAAARWAEVRPALRDHLGTRLELRLGEAADSEVDRKAAANIPADAPGRGLTQGPYHFLGALPRVDGVAEPGSLADGTAALVERVRGAWPGRSAPRVRNLPAVLPATDLPVGPTDLRDRIPLGIDEDRLAPVGLTFATEPHLVVLGDSRCGKTNLLRHIARQIDARNTVVPGLTTAAAPRVGWLIVVDFRRALLDVAGLPSVLKYVRNAEELTALVRDLKANLEQRLPGPDVTPAQLRGQSWWRGKAMFVLVDDYDLVAQSGANPLAPLSALLSQGSDIGFHLVVARRAAGSGRALHDQVIGPMRSIDAPALLMSGNRDEGALFGSLRPGPLPPGRGHLVRSSGVALIQTPLSEPDPE